MFIKAQDIFDQTRGGLDAILTWCPDADSASPKKLFRFDAADTKPSCSMYEHGGIWWVKNHGEDWPAMHAIQVVMRQENASFPEACSLIGDRLGLTGEEPDKKTKPGFEYRAEKPAADETEDWHHIEYGEFSATQLKTIFSINIWNYLGRIGNGGQFKDETAVAEGSRVCKLYHMFPVAWYAWVSRSKETNQLTKHIIRATDTYPIYCYDETDFKKVYQPKAKDEKDRFRYFGKKPAQFLHGMLLHRLKWEQENKVRDNSVDDNGKDAQEEEFKHPEIILCSGGSDALNVAALGYPVIWKNSEKEPFLERQYKEIRKICRHFYLLYDSDFDGRKQAHKIAMQFLETRTIYLPDFRDDADRDWRGKKYKDVRDYFQKYKSEDFKNLLKNAYPLRFWDEQIRVDRKGDPVVIDGEVMKKYTPLPTLIRNFLYRNGFARLVMGVDESGTKQWEFVRLLGNIVRKVSTEEIRQFLHAFLEERCFDWRMRDAFSRSTDLTDAQLALLPEIELEFDDFDSRTQFLFFNNKVWKITKAGIEEQDASKSKRFVWSNEVIPHAVQKKEPPFTIYRDEQYQVRVRINNQNCLFFRYLINASRVHWRKELEQKLDLCTPEEREAYLKANEYRIDGPLLDDDAIQEQMQHLANKITAFGYCLHRYKNKAEAYAIWSMDNFMDDPDASSGGTGKSMSAGALTYLMPVHTLNGRNEEEIRDKFKFEGVTKHTDLVWIDDAHKQTPFDEFFSLITNFMTINRKGLKTTRLDFRDSPKLYITSNYTPTKIESSTWRRLWFTTYSDYYHYNPKNQYRETRRPFDDFGKQLFEDFTPDEWNAFFNFMAACVQAWMEFGRIDPPMENLLMNTYRQKVGKEFMDWADAYFSSDSGRLDTYHPRYKAFANYTHEVKNSCSNRAFKEKLELWALYYNYTLNPALCEGYRSEEKRITIKAVKEVWSSKESRWITPDPAEPESIEFFYIQTPSTDVSPFSPKGDGLPF